MQTQGAIGNLINRYRAVLNKCRLLNVFGSLAVAGLLVMGGAGVAGAEDITTWEEITADRTIQNNNYYGELSGKGTQGGALYIVGASDSNIIEATIKSSYFSGNIAPVFPDSSMSLGGSISSNYAKLNIYDSTFKYNSTLTNMLGFGGAISIGNNTVAYIENTNFDGNNQYGRSATEAGGGAIKGASTSSITIVGGSFSNNTAEWSGGAIKADGSLVVKDGTTFTGNVADGYGGAISTATTTKSVLIDGATFSGNSAIYEGGAIYMSNTSEGALTLSGKNTFSDNWDSFGLNDITSANPVVVSDGSETDLRSGYKQAKDDANLGTGVVGGQSPSLTVNAGAKLSAASMTLGGYYTNTDGTTTTGDGGTVTVAKGGILGNGTTNMDDLKAAIANAEANGVKTDQGFYVGKASLNLANASMGVGQAAAADSPGNVAFAAESALVVDQAALNGAPAFANVTTASMEDGSALHVQNAVAGQTLTIFADNTGANKTIEDTTKDVSITTDNKLVTFDKAALLGGNNGQAATAQLADVSSVVPGLSPELAAVAASASSIAADATQPGTRFVRKAFHPDLSAAETEATLESAARVAAIAGVPQMTWAAQKAANAAVTQRTSLAAPSSMGLQAVAADGSVQTGASAGDAMKNGFAMWIMPLYQSWNAWGMEGGNLDMDVNGALGGLAVGADYTFAHAFRAGITVNMGGGYAEGSGDFSKTTNNFTYWGLGAYLGWSKDNFGLTADINHTWVYNDVEQDILHAMQMDSLKSDITSRALSVGLRGEYKLATDALDITPHVGVRYTYLTTDKYEMESTVLGGNVTEADAIHQGIWTFPIGVAFSKDVQMDSGWYVKPSLDVAIIPAAGDIKARGDVRFTGTPVTAEVSTQTMDYISYMGQAGVEFGNDNVKLGVNYNLQMGAQSTAHSVFGTLRYEF